MTFWKKNWHDLEDFQVSRYPKIVTALYINFISASENDLECCYSTIPMHFWALNWFLELLRLQVVQTTFYFSKMLRIFEKEWDIRQWNHLHPQMPNIFMFCYCKCSKLFFLKLWWPWGLEVYNGLGSCGMRLGNCEIGACESVGASGWTGEQLDEADPGPGSCEIESCSNGSVGCDK